MNTNVNIKKNMHMNINMNMLFMYMFMIEFWNPYFEMQLLQHAFWYLSTVKLSYLLTTFQQKLLIVCQKIKIRITYKVTTLTMHHLSAPLFPRDSQPWKTVNASSTYSWTKSMEVNFQSNLPSSAGINCILIA